MTKSQFLNELKLGIQSTTPTTTTNTHDVPKYIKDAQLDEPMSNEEREKFGQELNDEEKGMINLLKDYLEKIILSLKNCKLER